MNTYGINIFSYELKKCKGEKSLQYIFKLNFRPIAKENNTTISLKCDR